MPALKSRSNLGGWSPKATKSTDADSQTNKHGGIKLTKTELIAKLAEKTDLNKKNAGAALDAAVDVIAEALIAGDKVIIPGFGTFEVRERAARKGRNPQTGEAMEIEAAKVPAFKAGKTLKDAVAV